MRKPISPIKSKKKMSRPPVREGTNAIGIHFSTGYEAREGYRPVWLAEAEAVLVGESMGVGVAGGGIVGARVGRGGLVGIGGRVGWAVVVWLTLKIFKVLPLPVMIW